MRNVLLRLAAVLSPLILVACGDLPTSGPLPDASAAGRLLSGECTKQTDGSYLCPPVTNDPVEPPDPCMELTGNSDHESTTVQSCPPSGGDGGTSPAPGGGSKGGGDTPIGGGGTPGPAPTQPPPLEMEQPDTCATNDPVVNDAVVEAAFAELWRNSNPFAPQSERVEQAAWVVQTQYGLENRPVDEH